MHAAKCRYTEVRNRDRGDNERQVSGFFTATDFTEEDGVSGPVIRVVASAVASASDSSDVETTPDSIPLLLASSESSASSFAETNSREAQIRLSTCSTCSGENEIEAACPASRANSNSN